MDQSQRRSQLEQEYDALTERLAEIDGEMESLDRDA